MNQIHAYGRDRPRTTLAIALLLFLAAITAGETGAFGTTGSIPAAVPPRPLQYADLQLQVSTGSDWTTVSLLNATLVDSHTVSTSPGSSVSFNTAGVGITNSAPSAMRGTNSAAASRSTVNLVYQLPSSGNVTLQVCRGQLGLTTATLTRRAPQDPVVSSLADRALTGWVGSCYDPANSTLAVSSLSGGTSAWPRPVSTTRHVLAAYYPWYNSSTFSSPPVLNGFTESWWPDVPRAPYDTTSASSVDAQVAEAAAKGIDGFVLEFNGDPTLAARNQLVTAAAESRHRFYVAPMVDLAYLPGLASTFSLQDQAHYISQWTAEALATTKGRVQLTQSGRPVVFYYDTAAMSPSAWVLAESQLSQAGEMPYAIGDATGATYGMPGLFSYSPNSVSNDADLPAFYEQLQQAARFDSAVGNISEPQQLLVAPVSPGMNNTEETLPWNSRIDVWRAGGIRYDDTWSSALALRPDWVLVTTWNEWYESTGIAPSLNAGTTALSQTGQWAALWRTSSGL